MYENGPYQLKPSYKFWFFLLVFLLNFVFVRCLLSDDRVYRGCRNDGGSITIRVTVRKKPHGGTVLR